MTNFKTAVQMARRMQRVVFVKQQTDVTDPQFDEFFAIPHDVRMAAIDVALRCLPAQPDATLRLRLYEYKCFKLFGA